MGHRCRLEYSGLNSGHTEIRLGHGRLDRIGIGLDRVMVGLDSQVG